MSEGADSRAIIFVIDVLPDTEEQLARARELVGQTLEGLVTAGITVNQDLGIGLAIDDSRAAILDQFGKRPSTEPDTSESAARPTAIVDGASASSWADLPEDRQWENAALVACTSPSEGDGEVIVVASRDPDSGDFVYIRADLATIMVLNERLAGVIVDAQAGR